ncbi:hypothetical protein Q8A64_13465 [Oxalobacteraceae bacterium R-40]|uniref:DUF4124 domain-containing protein n=1 Tax=Keguizhuia sedimenti TaxID=3064264 RepID=A0ABU1BR55_9BURK|nr:hypothetical protein [Oxalobacteraceae bacterium R-40]
MKYAYSSPRSLLARISAALVMSLACMPSAQSAEVNKCIVNGKTIYQEAPCAGEGKALKLNSEISREQMWEANRRASDQRRQSSDLELKRRNDQFQEQVRARNDQLEKERREARDCTRLAKEVEAAEAQMAGARFSPQTRAIRCGTLMSEKDAKAESDAVDRAVDAASSRLITARMNQQNADCK